MNARLWSCLALFLAAVAVARGAAAEIFMSTPILIDNPGGPIRTRLPDLNGDGITDLVVLNNGANSINVYRGTGGGSFAPPVVYGVGAGPTDLVVTDMNNDGKLDLVVLNTGGNSVSLLRGNGDGTFAPAETYGVGANPTRFDVFHGNAGPGRIVTVDTGGDSITYLAMQNNGTMAAAVTFAVGKSPSYILRADLDNDGQAEFVVANAGDDTISVITRSAAGVPASSATYPTGTNPQWIGAGDATGDGKRDLIVSNSGSDNVSFYVGNGDRSLLGPFNIPVGQGPREIAVADLNGDGISDAVVRNSDGTYSVLLGAGDGNAHSYDGGGASAAGGMDVRDFDGDGKLDIVGVVTVDRKFAILPGNGDGKFGAARVFAAGSAPGTRWGSNDIDGDGRADLAIPNPAANAVVMLLQKSIPPALGTVAEFYNTLLDNYFITADPNEAAAIDNGSAGPGWSRTGANFNFSSGGNTYVCRFYGSISPGPNSHFYTAGASECADLKALQQTTPPTEPRWNFESLDFVTTRPLAGACPAGTSPVYRAYNNGFSRHVDSNHRITGDADGIAQVVSRGWVSEGVVMCAPQ